MLVAWRPAALAFARSVEDMLSGERARRYGGRWNSPGRPAVYLGDSLALAAMELLVHLGTAHVLGTYREMPAYLPEELVMHIEARVAHRLGNSVAEDDTRNRRSLACRNALGLASGAERRGRGNQYHPQPGAS